MSLKGNIKTFYLSSLLQILSNDKKTGILKVSDSDNTVELYINEGTVVFATSTREEQRLCYFLEHENLVDRENLDACLAEAREKKQKVGKVLVEKKLITAEHLTDIIHHQVETIIYNLFLWESGEFEYEDTSFDLKGQIVTEFDTMEIVLEASRRVDEISVLKKHLPNTNEVLKTSTTCPEKRDQLNDNEKPILALVNNRRTIKKIIDDSGYDDFSVYKILYSLISSGLVEKSDDTCVIPDLLQLETTPTESPAPETEKPDQETDTPPVEAHPEKTPGDPEVSSADASAPAPDVVVETPLTQLKDKNVFRFAAATKKNIIILASGLFAVLAVIVFLVVKPAPSPTEPQKKIRPAPADGEVQPLPPAPEKTVDAPAGHDRNTASRTREAQEPAPVYFQDSADIYSITLPHGFEYFDESTSKYSKAKFSYAPNITLTIIARSWQSPWSAEDEMYKRIMTIEKESTEPSPLKIHSYSTVTIGGGRGYEIGLSGYRDALPLQVRFYAVVGLGKAVFIDLYCSNWKTRRIAKQLDAIISSIHNTLILHK